MGIHPSTYYRWKRQLDRDGPEILRPGSDECRRWPIRPACWSSSEWSPSPPGHPGFGPARIAAELASPAGARSGCRPWGLAGPGPPRPVHPGQAGWAGRRLRGATWAAAAWSGAWAAPGRRSPRAAGPAGLFCIGRLSGTKGTVWQYTTIDVASASTWATLQVTPAPGRTLRTSSPPFAPCFLARPQAKPIEPSWGRLEAQACPKGDLDWFW